MDYLGSNLSINWLFILAVLSFLQWVFIGCYVLKNYDILGNKISNNAFDGIEKYKDNSKVRIPFIKDYFFIYWNIYPLIFYGFFYYLSTSWKTYLNEISMLAGDNVKELYVLMFKSKNSEIVDILFLVVILIIAYFSSYKIQLKKQRKYRNFDDRIYWWDIRISKKIFNLRLIFLFTNIILIGFMMYLLFKIIFLVIYVLYSSNIYINPFFPDSYGGLKVFMEIASIIFNIFLFHSLIGIVSYVDHKDIRNIKFQLYGDLLYLFFFPLAFLFLFIFTYKIDSLLSTIDTSDLLSHAKYMSFAIDSNLSFEKIILKSNDMLNYYTSLSQFNKFPIDLSLFTNVLFTFIFPLVFWLISNVLINKHDKL